MYASSVSHYVYIVSNHSAMGYSLRHFNQSIVHNTTIVRLVMELWLEQQQPIGLCQELILQFERKHFMN